MDRGAVGPTPGRLEPKNSSFPIEARLEDRPGVPRLVPLGLQVAARQLFERVIAEHADERLIGHENAAVRCRLVDADWHPFEQRAIALLAGAERLLRANPVGHVLVHDDGVLENLRVPLLRLRAGALGGGAGLLLTAMLQRTDYGRAEPPDALLEHIVGRARLHALDRRLLVHRAGDDDERGVGRLLPQQ
jgi:hypothetical protein